MSERPDRHAETLRRRPTRLTRTGVAALRPHQRDALAAIVRELENPDGDAPGATPHGGRRATAVMACGTGKTRVATGAAVVQGGMERAVGPAAALSRTTIQRSKSSRGWLGSTGLSRMCARRSIHQISNSPDMDLSRSTEGERSQDPHSVGTSGPARHRDHDRDQVTRLRPRPTGDPAFE